MFNITPRQYSGSTAMALIKEGASPILARVLAGRGLTSVAQVAGSLKNLHHHSQLKNADAAASYLADCIQAGKKMVVVADYDCDGATACAVALRGLKAFGAHINYIVPDRMIHGYGLTPSVVDLAKERFPDTEVLVTVDNGVASHKGVDRAVELGLDVVVTDHHMPSKTLPLPNAKIVVDPVQPGCEFPSKALAGVGVIWYVLWALQDELRTRGVTFNPPSFKVSQLLPLVAVGTVADVVPLDANNRVLVQAGLDRIREGTAFPGINALAQVGHFTRVRLNELMTSHIAFGIGPRINAAGRLETMDAGIACLTTDDENEAQELAEQLDAINQERKEIEFETVVEAFEQANAMVEEGTFSIAVHSDSWHAGVIGIVAGRIKEQRYRPTFVLTTDPKSGEIKGSGRSIPGCNIKDVLDQVDKACPGLLIKFGGHAMAAGVTLKAGGFEQFKTALEEQVRAYIDASILSQKIEVDGSLMSHDLKPETVKALSGPPWGQMFPEPVFFDEFNVVTAKIGGAHSDQLSMVVERDGVVLDAVKFRHAGPLPVGRVNLAYKLSLKYTKYGKPEVNLMLDHVTAAN